MSDETQNQDEAQKLHMKLADILVDAFPQDVWEDVTLDFAMIGDSNETKLSANPRTSGEKNVDFPAQDATEVLAEMKKIMSTEERGAWFSVHATLVFDKNEFSLTFNYDDHPQWDNQPPTRDYFKELKTYPRPEGQIPAWFPREEN